MRRIIEICHQLINKSLISYHYHSYHSILLLFTNKLIFYSCLIRIKSSLHLYFGKNHTYNDRTKILVFIYSLFSVYFYEKKPDTLIKHRFSMDNLFYLCKYTISLIINKQFCQFETSDKIS